MRRPTFHQLLLEERYPELAARLEARFGVTVSATALTAWLKERRFKVGLPHADSATSWLKVCLMDMGAFQAQGENDVRLPEDLPGERDGFPAGHTPSKPPVLS